MRLYGLQPARLLCPWEFFRQEYWSVLCKGHAPVNLNLGSGTGSAEAAAMAVQPRDVGLARRELEGRRQAHFLSRKPSAAVPEAV